LEYAFYVCCSNNKNVLHNLLYTVAHETFASLQVVGILVYFVWVRSLTITQILPIPAEYPCQYWDTLLLPYIHIQQFLSNLSSVITVRKMLCLVVHEKNFSSCDLLWIFISKNKEYVDIYVSATDVVVRSMQDWMLGHPICQTWHSLIFTCGDIWRSWCMRMNHRHRCTVMGHP
jgi:hypothetical protein